MSGPRGGHDREQPQGQQPPWDGYPPPGYPPQYDYPSSGYPPQAPPTAYLPSGYGVPPAQPRRRVRRKRSRRFNAFLLVCAAIFLVGVIASALGNGNGNSSKSAAAATSSGPAVTSSSHSASKASAGSKKLTAKEDACDKRPAASGDIYVRMVTPGVSPQAQELGGEWRWDSAAKKCLTSVQLTVATAPLTHGNCTQVGYVADNPGYDVNARVAPRLTHLVAQAGPACPKAAASTPVHTTPAPVHTTPAAAPSPPPASTAPASCHPLTNGGNCYEPGEFCRASDHGVSGVAGDGEAITCKDNDGWRWEPS